MPIWLALFSPAQQPARRKPQSGLALGATRKRLFAQFLTESLLISLLGAGAGWFAASGLLATLAASIPFDLPATARLRPDFRVLLFTLAVGVATALLFSLLPLAKVSRLDLNGVMKQGGARSGVGRQHAHAQHVLIIGEVAISVALLVGTTLLIERLYHMQQEKLGFQPEGVISLRMSVGKRHRTSSAARWNFEREILSRFEAIPGVLSVARVSQLPLSGPFNLPTEHVGKSEDSIGGMEYRAVTPNYFETLGVPILAGRGVSVSDIPGAPEVAVISESVARQWFPDRSPIGERLQVGRYQGRDFPEIAEPQREIVGVVGDVKAFGSLMAPSPPTVYVPAAQMGEGIAGGSAASAWVLRARSGAALTQSLRTALAEVDPEERIIGMRSMPEIVSQTMARPRFDSTLMGVFAVLAVLLAGIGIFGVLSYSFSCRTHEIGVRMALGAARSDVLRLFVLQAIALTVAGIVLGSLGAWALSRFLESLLVGVNAHDPGAFVSAVLIMMAVAFFASYIPARRASRVDPLIALRDE